MTKKLRYSKNRRDVDTLIGVIRFKRIAGEGFRIKCKGFPKAIIRLTPASNYRAEVHHKFGTTLLPLRANPELSYQDVLWFWSESETPMWTESPHEPEGGFQWKR